MAPPAMNSVAVQRENKMHVHGLARDYSRADGLRSTRSSLDNYNCGREFRLTDNFGNVVKDIIAGNSVSPQNHSGHSRQSLFENMIDTRAA